MSAKLFSEFPPLTKSDWLDEIQRDLKGKAFDTLIWQTLEGIEVQPIYSREDATPLDLPVKPVGEWLIREEIFEQDISQANARALDVLNRGATALAFFVTPKTESEMAALMSGIWLEAAPVHFYTCKDAEQVLALFMNEVRRRNLDAKFVHGSIDVDAIAAFATTGTWDSSAFERAGKLVRSASPFPHFKTLTIRADVYHNAGSSLVQELAFALASIVDYLDALTEQGISPGEIFGSLEVSLAVSSSYFLEIAKFRAARWLFHQLGVAYGATATPTIHASSARWNKTIYDAHNNLLRGTVEAMAAASGGADSITVARFDEVYAKPNEVSAHLSRNTSLILRDEAHLGKVIDAASGSYFLESLTESIANQAWKCFQHLEAKGGMLSSLRSGFVQSDIRRVRQAREKLVAEKKLNFIGVTKSPNAKENMKAKLERKPEPASAVSMTEIEPLVPFRAVEALEVERLNKE